MTHQIIIETQAQSDLEEAYRRIAQGSAERAAQWYNGIVDAIASLANFPERCAFARENAFFPEDIRQLLYGKRGNVYRILFTITQDTVHVLHIRHGSRPPLQPPNAASRKLH
jgi:plasmid stabilization system protein ParE